MLEVKNRAKDQIDSRRRLKARLIIFERRSHENQLMSMFSVEFLQLGSFTIGDEKDQTAI